MMAAHDIRDALLATWKTSPKERTLDIRGTSMRPLIVEGDRIVIEPVGTATPISIGDIVVFESATGLVAHRIIDRIRTGETTSYLEKGDNRFYPTSIDHQALIGRVIEIRKARSVVDLTSWHWKTLSLMLGVYWRVLFRVFNGLVRVKHAVFGSCFGRGRGTRYVRWLIRLPAGLLKRKTGHSP
jgi:signal peptidase I